MTLTPVRVPTRTPAVTRRRRLLVAATLAVTLCAGYLSATIGHRLEHGSSWWHGADAESRTEGPRTELRFAFNPGRQVTLGASIRNPGPWPVAITGIAGTSSAAATASADGCGFFFLAVTSSSVVITAPSSPGTKPDGSGQKHP